MIFPSSYHILLHDQWQRGKIQEGKGEGRTNYIPGMNYAYDSHKTISHHKVNNPNSLSSNKWWNFYQTNAGDGPITLVGKGGRREMGNWVNEKYKIFVQNVKKGNILVFLRHVLLYLFISHSITHSSIYLIKCTPLYLPKVEKT